MTMLLTYFVVLATLLVLSHGKATSDTAADITPFFGAKYKPGDVVPKTDYSSVNKILDDVIKAGGILEGRRCAIGVANLGAAFLTNPKWYMDSGNIYSSLPFDIPPGKSGVTLFHKKAVFIWGTTGLLTYDIDGTDYKLAIMWQVPWNIVLYDVEFNTKIYNKAVPTDKAMFKQMKKYAGPMKSTGWIKRTEYGISYSSTITNNNYAKLYVSVDASEYDAVMPPHMSTGCDTKASWFGSYCWQECHPTGYCWVDKKCNSATDCANAAPLTCFERCQKQ